MPVKLTQTRAWALIAAGLAVCASGVFLLVSALPGDESSSRDGTLKRPIDPRQGALAFGERSHWLQPWRSYLDTPPATQLRNAIGINFNVEPEEAEATARLLAANGFKRARVEFGWDSISPADPRRLRDPARFRTMLSALRRHDIRPLILLNANHNGPGPTQPLTLQLAEPAAQGARRVRLTRGSARQVRTGHTGLNNPEGKAADVIFIAVDDRGGAELSKPLPRALTRGDHPGTTLKYEPFGAPRLSDGGRNPRFEKTLQGWLDYTTTVVQEARSVLRNDDFDVEVWNEQTFGADFLYQDRYYDPPRETGEGDVTATILRRTVRAIRGVSSQVGIGDGFASQTPFPAGSTSPRGLTAIDKHPYYGIKRFPQDAVFNEIKPLDANGRPSFTEKRSRAGQPVRRDRVIPRYDAFFPEYILSAIQTESMTRDLSPRTTKVNGVAHGRNTHPPGGKPPEVWITEANLDPTGADPSDPDRPGSGPVDKLRSPDIRRLHAKAALRFYTAFVNKGVSAVDLFAVKGGDTLSLVEPRFFERLGGGSGYPGDGTGGLITQAVGRLSKALASAQPLSRRQPLTVQEISDDHGNSQFAGNPHGSHPPLYDRDVLAFFPFQLATGRWVAAVYVMTRNLARPYGDGSDPSRFDLPPARFRIKVSGLDGRRLAVRGTDPLSGSGVDVKVLSRTTGGATIEVPATDSPRLVFLTDR